VKKALGELVEEQQAKEQPDEELIKSLKKIYMSAREKHAYSLQFNQAKELQNIDPAEFKMYFEAITLWFNEFMDKFNLAEKNNSSQLEQVRQEKEFAEITQRAATAVRFDIE